jgi:hypothetical protein
LAIPALSGNALFHGNTVALLRLPFRARPRRVSLHGGKTVLLVLGLRQPKYQGYYVFSLVT